MQKHMKLRAPQIAQEFIGLWKAHSDALDQTALLYIDRLIEAAVMAEPLTMAQLRRKLTEMIPGMQYGTARRLVRLKYPHLEEADLIKPEFLN